MYLINYHTQNQIDARIIAGETNLIAVDAWSLNSNYNDLGVDVSYAVYGEVYGKKMLVKSSDAKEVSPAIRLWKKKGNIKVYADGEEVVAYKQLSKAEVLKIDYEPDPKTMLSMRDFWNVQNFDSLIIMTQTGTSIGDTDAALDIAKAAIAQSIDTGKREALRKKCKDVLHSVTGTLASERYFNDIFKKWAGDDATEFADFYKKYIEVEAKAAEEEKKRKKAEEKEKARLIRAANIKRYMERFGYSEKEAEIFDDNYGFEGHKKVWALRHGSERLKKGVADGYNMNRIYHEERLLSEIGYAGKISETSCSLAANPSLEALNAAEVLEKKLGDGYDAYVVWDDRETIEIAAEWAKVYYILDEIPEPDADLEVLIENHGSAGLL